MKDLSYNPKMNSQDRLLDSKVGGAFERAAYGARFVGFLDMHERGVALRCAGNYDDSGCRYAFWGGYEGAERVFLGVFPPYEEPDTAQFPISAVNIVPRSDGLTHRDYLGAILGLGIKREKLGDIIVSDECVVLAESVIAEYIVRNLSKVGSNGVRCTHRELAGIIRADCFSDIRTTVASVRLDCIVAALAKLSRGGSAELIGKGLVSVDCEIELQPSKTVNDGSAISVRGSGRYIVDRIGPVTRKGRYSFTARKYI